MQTSLSTELAPMWEIVKGILLFTATGLLGWIARTLSDLVKRQTKLEHIVVGVEGTNGLRSDVKNHEIRIGTIEDRNLVIDAVAKVEEDNYQGEERRHGLRRLRDMIREEMQAHASRSSAT